MGGGQRKRDQVKESIRKNAFCTNITAYFPPFLITKNAYFVLFVPSCATETQRARKKKIEMRQKNGRSKRQVRCVKVPLRLY